MKKVLVINLGWEQEPLIRKLSERDDCMLYGIHYDDKSSCFELFQDIKITDLRNLKEIIEFASQIKPDAVISDQCDYSLMAQAVVAERFNLPGPSIRAAQLSNNKYLQRLQAKKMGLCIPEFKLCITIEDIKRFAKKHGFPIIVKPVDNRGSFGVSKVKCFEEITEAFFIALMNSYSRVLIAESFIDGTQITVDGYVFPDLGVKTLSLATKSLKNETMQVSMEIVYPGRLKKDIFNNVCRLNEKINRDLMYDFGMVHSEYIIKDEQLFLIESANRGGGNLTSEIVVPISSNIKLLDQYIGDSLNEFVNFYKKPANNEINLIFFDFMPGKVKGIENLEILNGSQDVVKYRFFIKPGGVIKEIDSDANRHGYAIIKGDIEVARKIVNTVRVVYE